MDDEFTLRYLLAQIAGMAIVFGVALFGAAGTIRWRAGWLFLALFFGFTAAISAWLARRNPELLVERMSGVGKADQKRWDKAFFAVANLLFLAWLVLMPLDAVRFRWSHVPALMQAVGVLFLLVSFRLYFLTFRENSFLSPAVRIQRERGHGVVSSGPYAHVRHPMYATTILFLVATSFTLGSWYGVLAALPLIVAMAVRAVLEEETLRRELPGYAQYMSRVPYRLIPYVW